MSNKKSGSGRRVSEEENARQIQRMRDALARLRAASLVRAAARLDSAALPPEPIPAWLKS
jgi:hypothetical protein